MGKSLRLKCWRALILLCCYAFLCSPARAQANFVQITDPHIFDDVGGADDNRLDDKAALASCIEEINRMAAQRGAANGADKAAPYDFVVVTGDLGLAKLVEGADGGGRENRLKAGAAELASLIGLSKVQTWLFVPGDTDLINDDPGTISLYYEFIAALREALAGMGSKIAVIDLCAEGAAGKAHVVNKLAFIGFDNASFLNAGAGGAEGGALLDRNFTRQLDNAARVYRLLAPDEIKHAYIFYHIPEVDDPSLVTLKEDQEPVSARYAVSTSVGSSFLYSAWFVKKEVRAEWNKAVLDGKVEGLFAGHFHDNKKETYQDFKWLRGSHYLPQSLAKLHVCPPLALRQQEDKTEQARGFQEVNIAEDGNVSTRIYWLGLTGWSLSAGVAALETSALRQMEIGRAYEGLGRMKEAEAAYAKAAESNWNPTRLSALASLRRVAESQDSPFDKNISSPFGAAWVAGLTAVGTAAITAVLTLLLVALVAFLWWAARPPRRLWKEYWKRKGRKKLKIGPMSDSPKGGAGLRFEQVVAMVHRRLRTHFKPRKTKRGHPELPVVATSLSADVAEFVETSVPGGMGKYVVWLLKQRERPQYSVDGVVQRDAFGHQLMFISLNEDGTPIKSWHEDSFGMHVVSDERKLAFKAMKRLVRHMNK